MKTKKLLSLILLGLLCSIGTAWADYTPTSSPMDTFALKNVSKPGGENRYTMMAATEGIYFWRGSNFSLDDSYGVKLYTNSKINDSGVCFYVSSTTILKAILYISDKSNTSTAKVKVYTLDSDLFKDLETGTKNSSSHTVTLENDTTLLYTHDYTFPNPGSTTTTKRDTSSFNLSAGYYYVTAYETTTRGKIRWESLILTSPPTPSLTGAWKISSTDVTGTTANVVQGGAATMPTFIVGATSGTPTAANYNLSYSLKDGSDSGIFTFTDGVPTAISTATTGSATIVATLTTKDNTKYLSPATTTFEYSVSVSAAAPPTISIETSKSSNITAGESITLTATVGGNPTPELKWYVNTENNTSTGSEVLGEAGDAYTFYAIAGTRYYYAKATNSVSTTTSNVITILGLVSRTVTYKNGNYTIFTEEVFDGNAITHTTHALNSRTFVGWYTDPELTSAAPATITSDITLYGKWTLNGGANYSTTANFEKYVLDNGTSTTGLTAYLTSHYFSSDKFTEWDSINADPAKDYDNYPYLGLKKPKNTSNGYITALVPANKTITFVLGSMAAAATLYIDGVAQSGKLAGSSTNKPASYSYTNTQISEYKLDITSINGTCILKGIFIEDEARGSYARTDLTAGNYGTICLPYAVAAGDYEKVSFYNVAGYNGESTAPTSIIIEEETGALVAGRPYIFKVADGAAQIFVFHKGDAASVDSYNGLIGSFTGTSVAASTAGTVGNYLLSSNTFVRAGTGCTIGENRAYLSMSAASPYTPAPGHRVIELSAETDNATNIENLNDADNVVKFLENGQLLIKRDGITFDALGRIVK